MSVPMFINLLSCEKVAKAKYVNKKGISRL